MKQPLHRKNYFTKKLRKMKTNEELEKDVQNAIKWEPLLHAAEIGVSVKDGVVTLSGQVDSYAKKIGSGICSQKHNRCKSSG